MKPNYDKWFYQEAGAYSRYLVVDSSKIVYFAGDLYEGYDYGESIYVNRHANESRVQSAAVLTNLTTSGGCAIVEIETENVPQEIKDIFERWLKKYVK